MKRVGIALGGSVAALLTSCAIGQVASLVADVRNVVPGNAQNLNSFPRPGALTSGGVLYFIANDVNHGWELWRTQGTPETTSLTMDVWPGPSSGCDPTNSGSQSTAPLFRGPNDTIFFFANVEASNSLWVICPDGSINQVYPTAPSDPRLLIDGNTIPSRAAVLGNSVYFAANAVVNNTSVRQVLWASDGTAAGTRIVFDPPTSSVNIFGDIATFDGRVFMACAGSTGTGIELWSTDGTGPGTVLVKDINTSGGGSSYPHGFTPFQGELYFFATPLNGGPSRFFRTDGTTPGTVQLTTTVVANTFNNEQPVATSEGVYFVGNNGTVYKWNGTTLNILSSSALANAANTAQVMAVLNDELIYANTNRLYRAAHDGTITTLNSTSISIAGDLMVVPSVGSAPARVHFTANSGPTGNEPWVSDGTITGTVLLKDVPPGNFGSNPRWLGVIGTKALFSATDSSSPNGTGSEPWITNGTPSGTILLRDINAQTSDSLPSDLFASSQSLYFDALDDSTGNERRRLDPPSTVTACQETVAGTVAWSRDQPTVAGGNVFSRVNFSNTLSIRAATTAEGIGTELVSIVGGSTTYNGRLYSDGTLCYFQFRAPGSSLDDGSVPWRSDGSIEGTFPLATLSDGSPSNVYAWTRYQNETYFLARYYGSSGGSYALYATSGTPGSTRYIVGAGGGTPVTSTLRLLTANGKLFYNAFSTGAQTQLWVYDGDGSPVRRVRPNSTSVGSQLTCTNPAVLNDRVIWGADIDQSQDAELWSTDGTESGTYRLKDIIPGTRGSFPANMTAGPSVAGQRIYFSANDIVHGRELWITDGTPDGTRLLKDIWPGPAGSLPQLFTPVGNLMYFLASDGVRGLEWWVTDGTESGTRLVTDINPGPAASYFANSDSIYPYVHAGNLYFAATDATRGRELWVIALPSCSADFNADTVVDFFDYLDFVAAFAANDPVSDFNADSVVDFFDYLDFVAAFAAGC